MSSSSSVGRLGSKAASAHQYAAVTLASHDYPDLAPFTRAASRGGAAVQASRTACPVGSERLGVAAKGGVGPVLKGQAGVNQVAADIEAAGGKVLGREVTVEANGVRTRSDLFVEDACGNRCFVEFKNGPSAGLTKNQSQAFPWIQSQGFIPRGGNAAAAGLTPGQFYGPMPVWTVYLP